MPPIVRTRKRRVPQDSPHIVEFTKREDALQQTYLLHPSPVGINKRARNIVFDAFSDPVNHREFKRLRESFKALTDRHYPSIRTKVRNQLELESDEEAERCMSREQCLRYAKDWNWWTRRKLQEPSDFVERDERLGFKPSDKDLSQGLSRI